MKRKNNKNVSVTAQWLADKGYSITRAAQAAEVSPSHLAKRDYKGDISRVVDLIGGSCVLTADGDFSDAIKAIRKMLETPEFAGSSVVKVKKLGFATMEPQYRDVKVSIRFANGGIG